MDTAPALSALRPLKAIALGHGHGHGHGQEHVGYSPLGRSEKKLPTEWRSNQGGQELGSHWVESVREGPQNGQGALRGGTSGLRVSGKEPAGNRLSVQGKGVGGGLGGQRGPGRLAGGELRSHNRVWT